MDEVLTKETIVSTESVEEVVKRLAKEQDLKGDDNSFYLVNVGDILHKYEAWVKELPRVRPCYAIKCNGDSQLVSFLIKLGVGFDCATMAEIRRVLDQGVPPDDIIYAHTYKQMSHLKYAANRGVRTMTFDTKAELHKIKEICPDAKLVIRLKLSGDNQADIDFKPKFGVEMASVPEHIELARDLGLNLIGVSFHVGTSLRSASSFLTCIADAEYAFRVGKEVGFNMQLLDLGGGFPGCKLDNLVFTEMAPMIRDALDKYFPASTGVRIIAEPGRYFMGSALTLATKIIGKNVKYAGVGEDDTPIDYGTLNETTVESVMARVNGLRREPSEDYIRKAAPQDLEMHYVVNEGIYGSFRGLNMGEVNVCPLPRQMRMLSPGEPLYHSPVWGRSTDSRDRLRDGLLPELAVGDWIIYDDVGSYFSSRFRFYERFPANKSYHYIERHTKDRADQHLKKHGRKVKPVERLL